MRELYIQTENEIKSALNSIFMKEEERLNAIWYLHWGYGLTLSVNVDCEC